MVCLDDCYFWQPNWAGELSRTESPSCHIMLSTLYGWSVTTRHDSPHSQSPQQSIFPILEVDGRDESSFLALRNHLSNQLELHILHWLYTHRANTDGSWSQLTLNYGYFHAPKRWGHVGQSVPLNTHTEACHVWQFVSDESGKLSVLQTKRTQPRPASDDLSLCRQPHLLMGKNHGSLHNTLVISVQRTCCGNSILIADFMCFMCLTWFLVADSRSPKREGCCWPW